MREELLKILTPIIDRSIKTMENCNEDEIVGTVVRLTKMAQKDETTIEASLELVLLTLLDEIKEKQDV